MGSSGVKKTACCLRRYASSDLHAARKSRQSAHGLAPVSFICFFLDGIKKDDMSPSKVHIPVKGSVIRSVLVRHEILFGGSLRPLILIFECTSDDLLDASVMYIYTGSDAHIPISRSS